MQKLYNEQDFRFHTAGYDVAQICLNGHVTNDSVLRRPQYNEKYCERCGKPTITECPKCKAPIRGHLNSEYINMIDPIDSPRFCVACGNPFPWFETKIEAAKELADIHLDLNEEERELLRTSVDDLILDNAKSQVAALKIKPLIKKFKQGAKDPAYKLLIEITSSTIAKIITINTGIGS